MKLYVLRHGETDGNVKGVMSGHQESYLTEHGKEEARQAREALADKKIDIVFASPLIRTKDTAIITANGKIPIVFDERLKSRNHGEFAGMRRSDVKLDEYWNYKKNKQYEKAESAKDIYDRVKSMVEYVKENYPGENVLFVTHSGVCRVLYHYFHGIPEDGDMLKGYEAVTGRIEEYDL